MFIYSLGEAPAISDTEWCQIEKSLENAVAAHWGGLAHSLVSLITFGLASPKSMAEDSVQKFKKCPGAVPKKADGSIDWLTLNCIADYWAGQGNQSNSSDPCPWFIASIPLACPTPGAKPEWEKAPVCVSKDTKFLKELEIWPAWVGPATAVGAALLIGIFIYKIRTKG